MRSVVTRDDGGRRPREPVARCPSEAAAPGSGDGPARTRRDPNGLDLYTRSGMAPVTSQTERVETFPAGRVLAPCGNPIAWEPVAPALP